MWDRCVLPDGADVSDGFSGMRLARLSTVDAWREPHSVKSIKVLGQQMRKSQHRRKSMTRLISAILVVGSFALVSGVALAAGQKNGFDTITISQTQGGSNQPCNNTSGCTTNTQDVNGGGNNPQPPVCDGPAGQCK
jgi:hypothetical protein